MIPNTIYTCWFSEDGSMPDKIRKCITSQEKVNGYEHKIITLDNVIKDHPYIQQCLNSTHKHKKWVKLKDFVQLYYLYHFGGWFLDADVQMFPDKNFDEYKNESLVVGIEGPGTIPNSIIMGAAVIGAEKNNSIIAEALSQILSLFRGDDDKCYESSLGIFTPLCLNNADKVKFTDPEVFYPYNHETGKTLITDKSICIHQFTKSWILPSISIIIPHLDIDGNRSEGLQKCIDSIRESDYPQNLIDIYIVAGEDTVPEKVKRGVNETKGEYIIYAANDMTFYPDSIRNAVECAQKNHKSLVSFNEGEVLPDGGNINTHFLIKRDFIPYIGGEIFSLELKHVGVDNLLWHKASQQNEAMRCENARIEHRHFSKGYEFDSVYKKGWREIVSDRDKLNMLLKKS